MKKEERNSEDVSFVHCLEEVEKELMYIVLLVLDNLVSALALVSKNFTNSNDIKLIHYFRLIFLSNHNSFILFCYCLLVIILITYISQWWKKKKKSKYVCFFFSYVLWVYDYWIIWIRTINRRGRFTVRLFQFRVICWSIPNRARFAMRIECNTCWKTKISAVGSNASEAIIAVRLYNNIGVLRILSRWRGGYELKNIWLAYVYHCSYKKQFYP